MGTAYEPLEMSFPLQKDTTARIYRRTRPVRPEEYREISDYLTGLYPDYAPPAAGRPPKRQPLQRARRNNTASAWLHPGQGGVVHFFG